MPKAEMLRYPVISATGEPDAFKRCMSGSERGGWKRTRKGNALAAYSTEWIADLLQHGLLRASFIPAARAAGIAGFDTVSHPLGRRTR
jgi:hypothetical protein